jgi:transcription factor C subunit 6
VVWNNGNGLANASLLASATASGLCRVDWLEGRWAKSRIPYNGIEGIRAEVEADEDMDEESD